MGFNTPDEVAGLAVDSGAKKAGLRWDRALVGGFLGGAYIGFGSLLAITTSAGLDPARWGTLPTLVTGAVFCLGLVLVVVAGAELLTGNMATLPLALLRRRISVGQLLVNFGLVLLGNLVGALFVAWVLSKQTGVIGASAEAPGNAGLMWTRLSGIASGKALHESELQIFLRALGCNWLVCLAIWQALAAKDIAGKILAIFFPITAFVAMGFDHVVANMYFLPLGVFMHVPGLGWGDVVHNLVLAFLGNLVGAGFFVAFLYWFRYLRGTGDDSRTTPGADEHASDDRARDEASDDRAVDDRALDLRDRQGAWDPWDVTGPGRSSGRGSTSSRR